MKFTYLLRSIAILSTAYMPTSSFANGYGIYDTRTLALGGTAVAMGNINNAHFYNPALTAFHEGDEDESKDGRHTIHLIGNNISEGAKTAASAVNDDLDGLLSDAIDLFNAEPSPESAAAGLEIATELEEVISKLAEEDINADIYLGYSVTEPGDREGGAFYVGSNILAIGVADIDDTDLTLLNDYIEMFDFLASDGTEGALHPELVDENGQLIDPSDDVLSTAAITTVVKTEMGLSFAKAYTLWGQDIAIGAVPKVVLLNVFDDSWGEEGDDFARIGSESSKMHINVDMGIAVDLWQHYRIALSVKDVMEKSVTTDLGKEITFKPKGRFAIAYIHPRFSLGLDVDLSPIKNLQNGLARQDASFGAEFRVVHTLLLRAGYRHDLEGLRDDSISGGLGWRWGRFAIDAAYSTSDTTKGGALEFSFMH